MTPANENVEVTVSVSGTCDFDKETYTVSNVQSNITITVEFKLEPPVFPVEWNAATGTLTFQVGSDGTTAATAMESDFLNENAVRKGLEQQAAWLTEHGFESFEPSAFDLKEQVKHLIVKDSSGISGIGYCAFSYANNGAPDTPLIEDKYNTSLESVDLSGVTQISGGAFKWCSALKELSLSGVQVIKNGAFCDDSGLTEIELSGVENVGEAAFSLCKNLTDVTLRDISIISISAFGRCEKLTNVHLIGSGIEIQNGPDSLIPSGAFAMCPQLEEVLIEGTLKEIGDKTFSLADPNDIFSTIPNPKVTIRCTGGVDAFKKACPDQDDPTKVGLSSWEQVQAL